MAEESRGIPAFSASTAHLPEGHGQSWRTAGDPGGAWWVPCPHWLPSAQLPTPFGMLDCSSRFLTWVPCWTASPMEMGLFPLFLLHHRPDLPQAPVSD